MSYVIGIDLGTSSLTGILVDRKGDVIFTASEEYPILTPQSGYSEQNPHSWFRAALNVLSKIFNHNKDWGNQIAGISFSGQMHSLVPLGHDNQPLRPAILWNDVRTTAECQKIMDSYGDNLLKLTKNQALEGFTLPKLLWMKENEPDLFDKMSTFLLPKDYLSFCLTGEKTMELSDASGTLLLDAEKKTWSAEIAEFFGIPSSLYPRLTTSYDKVGDIKKELLEIWGITQPIPVFAGGADNGCAALGAGIVTPDLGMVSIGTSGVFLGFEENGQQDFKGKLHYFNHVAKDNYYGMGVTLAAGYSLSWFKETFAKEQGYEQLFSGVADVPAGANGLLFTPYITGERSPHVDSQIRASFIGMDASHKFPDFVRAVVEGITFSLKDSQQLMEIYGNKKFRRIVSVGGGAKNTIWLQIQANIFNAVIVTLKSEEGPALGAAMLAALGAGWFEDEAECVETFVQYGKEYYPQAEQVAMYEKLYPIYKEIYQATRAINEQLSDFRK